MDPMLSAFFEPRGVVIVGASQHPQKLGYGLARNLLLSDYHGEIYFVNPKGGELFDRPIYQSINKVPDPVDLAVLLVPSFAVADSLAQCGARGIHSVIVSSGGFGEIGEEGAKLEQELLRVAKKHNIRMIGPNCIGLLDTHLPIDTTFLPPPGPVPGDIAFISHSGAICAAVIDWARGQGFGLSRLISLGNQIDVNETDMLLPVAADKYTKVLALYLEGVSDGRKFVEQASAVTKTKPIIALKVGRFESGRRAVASHTGAIAGQESAFNAAFRRSGVIRADTSEEMFNWAKALAWCPMPAGRNVAVLTNAGGPGVTAADALESNGLKLAKLSEDTENRLKEFLPSAASLSNPVDMLASASPSHYADSLRAVLNDPGVDSVMIILPPPPMYTAAGVANAMIPIIQTTKKPVVFALMGERLIQEAVERLRAAKIPEYRFPENAASALAVLADRADAVHNNHQKPLAVELDDSIRQELEQVLERAELAADGFLQEEDVHAFMDAYQIPVAKLHLAKTSEEAQSMATDIGFPVVLKIASKDITHKSDSGGVKLNLNSLKEIDQAYQDILTNVSKAVPGANISGCHVQKMVTEGQEVILGTIQDSQFGALIMFGSGGTEVEGLKDVAFSLAPVTQEDITHMLSTTWAGKKLKGFRNIPPGDINEVSRIIMQFGQMASDFPAITEMEINPLRVLTDRVIAVDIRIRK